MIFKGSDTSYFYKLKRDLGWGFLLFSGILGFIYFTRSIDKFLIAVVIAFLILTYNFIRIHLRIKTSIYKVEIDHDKLILEGKRYSTVFKSIIPINDIQVTIKTHMEGRSNLVYYLQVRQDDNKYNINKANNWDKKNMIDLFRALKKHKNENLTRKEHRIIKHMIANES